MARRGLGFWLVAVAIVIASLVSAVWLIWRDDILEALIDPQVPYDVYKPPPAPDYAKAAAWDQLPGPIRADATGIDVFFVPPTTFKGGKNWNGPIDDQGAAAIYTRVMAPNYAAPFARAGRVFAPRYRQASLYTSLTVFDDAIEAREFAYGDVRAAFGYFLDHLSDGRPFILVGVEQGGELAARLLETEIAANAGLRRRLVGAYLIDTVVPAARFPAGGPIPACQSRTEVGCVVAWISAPVGDFPRILNILSRSKVWSNDGRLDNLGGAAVLCVNPLLGSVSNAAVPPRLNLGAANATGLEWGARPGFLARQVGAQCVDGILRVTQPRSASLRPQGSWADRLRVPGYNLFWADLEADSLARVAAWKVRFNRPG
jgi:hypothetical protein